MKILSYMNYKDRSTIIEREFYQRVAMISGYSKTVVRDVFNAAYELVEDELKSDTPVVLGRFGTMMRHERNVGGGYNFHTGEKHRGFRKVARIKFTPSRPFQTVIKNTIKGQS